MTQRAIIISIHDGDWYLGILSFVHGGSERSDVSSKPVYKGRLHLRNNILGIWVNRHVELTQDSINIYTREGGAKLDSLKLGGQSRYLDSSLKPFSFSISNRADLKGAWIFHAANGPLLDDWKERLNRLLDSIRQHNASTTLSESHSDYINRPQVHVKILQARNLTAKDFNGTSDPYVKVSLGAQLARTGTRAKELNPVWGTRLNFDWDYRDRFIKIEVWDENDIMLDQFLGMVLIPMYALREGDTIGGWYPLCKTSVKSEITGKIEVEITCTNLPGLEPLVHQLFREVQHLEEFQIKGLDNLVQSSSKKAAIACEMLGMEYATGFPFTFPAFELEHLEDMSMRVTLVVQSTSGKLFCPGILMLTNYRLLFVSKARMRAGDAFYDNTLLYESDLSCQIPICNIVHCQEETSEESKSQSKSIEITDCEGRHLVFLFECYQPREVISSQNQQEVKGSLADLISLNRRRPNESTFLHVLGPNLDGKPVLDMQSPDFYVGNEHSRLRSRTLEEVSVAPASSSPRLSVRARSMSRNHVSDELSDQCVDIDGSSRGAVDRGIEGVVLDKKDSSVVQMIGVRRAWQELQLYSFVPRVDSVDSLEGPPAVRMVNRIRLRLKSRDADKYTNLCIHSKLLEAMQLSCVDVRRPDEDEEEGEGAVQLVDGDNLDGEATLFAQSDAKASGMRRRDSKFPQTPDKSRQDTDSASSPRLTSQDDLLGIAFSQSLFLDRLDAAEFSVKAHMLASLENCWYLYNATAEFGRLGIPDIHWRITELNSRYELCATYPAVLAVPHSIDDGTLRSAVSHRSSNRFPALSWRHPVNKCSITRCSQPKVGINNSRNRNDESLLKEINRCGNVMTARPQANPTQENLLPKLLVADARPLVNAEANKVAGKGYEGKGYEDIMEITFCSIPNIHAVRTSWESLLQAISAADEASISRRVDDSDWIPVLHKIIVATMRVVHAVALEDVSVLVHCSDGWDRTSQLTSLPMLLMDPYYRTLRGFIVLIEKEWLTFGHKFADRLGWTVAGWKDEEERSPVFLQFLDCVHQFLHQKPNCFEFNEALLIFIAEQLYTGWFADFMFNCEKEKRQFRESHGLISMWTAVLENQTKFSNPLYKATEGVVMINSSKAKLVLWSGFFLRWSDRVAKAAWLQEMNVEVEFHETRAKSTKAVTSQISASDQPLYSNQCFSCKNAFSVFKRCHRCNRCLNFFCSACCNQIKMVTSVSRYRPSRVCHSCASCLDGRDCSTDMEPTGHVGAFGVCDVELLAGSGNGGVVVGAAAAVEGEGGKSIIRRSSEPGKATVGAAAQQSPRREMRRDEFIKEMRRASLDPSLTVPGTGSGLGSGSGSGSGLGSGSGSGTGSAEREGASGGVPVNSRPEHGADLAESNSGRRRGTAAVVAASTRSVGFDSDDDSVLNAADIQSVVSDRLLEDAWNGVYVSSPPAVSASAKKK